MEDIIKKINKQVHTHLEEFKDRIISEHVDEFLGGGAPEELGNFWYGYFEEKHGAIFETKFLFDVQHMSFNCNLEHILSELSDKSKKLLEVLEQSFDDFSKHAGGFENLIDADELISSQYFLDAYGQKSENFTKILLYIETNYKRSSEIFDGFVKQVAKRYNDLTADIKVPEDAIFNEDKYKEAADIAEFISGLNLNDNVYRKFGRVFLSRGFTEAAFYTYIGALGAEKTSDPAEFSNDLTLWDEALWSSLTLIALERDDGKNYEQLAAVWNWKLEEKLKAEINFEHLFPPKEIRGDYIRSVEFFNYFDNATKQITRTLEKNKCSHLRWPYRMLMEGCMYTIVNLSHVNYKIPYLLKKARGYLLRCVNIDKEALHDENKLKNFLYEYRDFVSKILISNYLGAVAHIEISNAKSRDSVDENKLKLGRIPLDYLFSVGFSHPNLFFDRSIYSMIYSEKEDYKRYLDSVNTNNLYEHIKDSIAYKIRTFSEAFSDWGLEEEANYLIHFAKRNNIEIPARPGTSNKKRPMFK